MTASATTPYRSSQQAGRDGFGQLLRAEWTKFRTVRGWVIGMVVAALVTVLLGLLTASGSHCSVGPFPGDPTSHPCTGTLGPGGQAVTDSFYFVHQPLDGDGGITVRVTSLTGSDASKRMGGQATPGLQPWSKAGIIIKESTGQGSAYVAMMVTGSHGVRMQHNYTKDTPGLAGAVSVASPRWLRLTRTGDTISGDQSADGSHWTRVGTARLPGLPSTVQAGLFAASPAYEQVVSQSLGGSTATAGPTQATAAIDHVSLQGQWPSGSWAGTDIGVPVGPQPAELGGFQLAGGAFVVRGSGDIAPSVPPQGGATPIERTLVGAFAGLIAVIVVATMFITAEYRRGLIRLTLAASPRRGRVLAAKAVVIGAVTFVAGLAAAAVAIPLGERILRHNGSFIAPVPWLTELRLIAGTAALLTVAAVLALAIGTALRRSAGVVTAVIAAIVLPYILATGAVLPAGPSEWLLRLTPAAAFAIQQSTPQYPQVAANYTPTNGYFPLAPWAGLAVLCAYAALALGLAVVLLRRRDA
jgi:ABC-type transport system involved in multi-copper enzyme maturation permease subunit